MYRVSSMSVINFNAEYMSVFFLSIKAKIETDCSPSPLEGNDTTNKITE